MSTPPRRGGLGKGLGALIAPGPEPKEPEAQTLPDPSASDGTEVTAEAEDLREAPDAQDTPDPSRGAADAQPAPVPQPAPTPEPSAAPVGFAGVRLVELDPTLVARNPRQPRDVFDEEEIDQLATSLLDVGMLQPLVVRPLDGDRYELVAGERRLRAAIVAGLPTVPAIVRATEDADLLKEALVENIHRVQLNPLEEAAAYQQLLEDFGVTQEELAARLGRSRPTISNTIRLLSLPPGVQRRIAAGVITAGHAKALLSLDGPGSQQRLADRVVAEGLSVRATEEAARLMQGEEVPDSGGGRRGGGSRQRIQVPGLVELQDDLSDALEARVRIAMGARKGRLTVEFLSVNDLERIVGIIADGLGSPSAQPTPSATAGTLTEADAAAAASQATAAEALAQRRRVRFDDLADLDLEGMRRATDLSDLED
jgi:ParB family transcriptional regulator, chromosome partitioning protein